MTSLSSPTTALHHCPSSRLLHAVPACFYSYYYLKRLLLRSLKCFQLSLSLTTFLGSDYHSFLVGWFGRPKGSSGLTSWAVKGLERGPGQHHPPNSSPPDSIHTIRQHFLKLLFKQTKVTNSALTLGCLPANLCRTCCSHGKIKRRWKC